MTTLSISLANVRRAATVAFILSAMIFGLSVTAFSQRIQVIGGVPVVPYGVVVDSAGNVFGTYSNTCCGQVYEVSPKSGGGWTTENIYTFASGTTDGDGPGSLIIGPDGKIYGATIQGGSTGCYAGVGCGTIFQLSPASDGGWTETVIYSFSPAKPHQGFYPGLSFFDNQGNFYGVTNGGGDFSICPAGCGVAFKLSSNSDGTWTEHVLYQFPGGASGTNPLGLTRDANGNLYGAMQRGGDFGCRRGGCGLIYELEQSTQGWTEKVLHVFHGLNGSPNGGLTFDAAGNLYATTNAGGPNPNLQGVVFRLSPASGTWTETVIDDFTHSKGYAPASGLIFDAKGNLYGSTEFGNFPDCGGGSTSCGGVFELSPTQSDGWKVVAEFPAPYEYQPIGELVFDSAGNLYATAYDGHAWYGSVIFRITP